MVIDSSQNSNLKYPVITMGTFDGVHLGHQALLQKVVERAKINSGESVVITFLRHPREVLNEDIKPYIITEKEQKEAIIKEIGIDQIVSLSFDHKMSLMSADDFLKDIIVGKYNAKEIVLGHDCHFGHSRCGNFLFLENNQHAYNYTPMLVTPVANSHQVISSSLIRSLINTGDIEEAAALLGRNYDLQGLVVEGKKIGRQIGFPTINLTPLNQLKLIPYQGVYLTKTEYDGKAFFSLTNIGISPTLKNSPTPSIECYLFNFSGELYGEKIKIEFIKRIRDERKFSNKEELVAAIQKDKQFAEAYIGELEAKQL